MLASVLVIDDDKLIHKIVRRALEPNGFELRTAINGESGIAEALANKPDIILLDVEMPGANGYEVCNSLKGIDETKDIPVVFLSSQSSLRERLQGYEVGADDYLTKPFDVDHLVARLKVLTKYNTDRRELHAQYNLAKQAALTVMSSSSEIALAMQFMERSILYTSVDETMGGLFETTDLLSIECIVCVYREAGRQLWFSSDGVISPLEKELIDMSDRESRFLDFGSRTLVNYPSVSILVKNMPVEDRERYGRMKDLMPVLLSMVNTKLTALNTHSALIEQSADLKLSFSNIRKNLFDLASTIVDNRGRSDVLASNTIQKLSMDLLSMGLEEDQETYLLENIETSFDQTLEAVDVGAQVRDSFSYILENLEDTMSKHDILLDAFIGSQAAEDKDSSNEMNDGIELF